MIHFCFNLTMILFLTFHEASVISKKIEEILNGISMPRIRNNVFLIHIGFVLLLTFDEASAKNYIIIEGKNQKS